MFAFTSMGESPGTSGTPVVAVTILLVAAERLFHIGVFDPALDPRGRGDPVAAEGGTA